jgi:uncharacterized protein YprB with RNaseH-like and TPR domain
VPVITSACFDIETSSLDGHFGIILVAAVKPNHGKIKVFRLDEINKKWKTERSNDKELVIALSSELLKYDILVAHNGLKFDIPFIRARMAFWNLGTFPNKKIIDPYQIAKNNFRVFSKSLDSLSDLIGCKKKKTPVQGRYWIKAVLDGDKKSMDYIVEHCVRDVEILEELLNYVKGYSPLFNHNNYSW